MKPPDELAIRPAIENDAPLLLELVRELAAFVNLSADVMTDEAMLRQNLFGPKAAAEALLAFSSGEAAGYAVFFPTFSTFLGQPGLYLEDLFVRSRFRHRGYGRTLFRHVAREANRRGCPRLEWTVLAWNNAAIKFYESSGAMVLPENRTCRLSGEALRNLGA